MLTILNPATEEQIARLERAGVEETDAAIAAANIPKENNLRSIPRHSC